MGLLTLEDDGRELTLKFGNQVKMFFSAYDFNEDTLDARMLAAARDAADFCRDVVADRICFFVYSGNDGYIGYSWAAIEIDSETNYCISRSGVTLPGWVATRALNGEVIRQQLITYTKTLSMNVR